MLYVREDIPSNLTAFEDRAIEGLFIELNFQNTKMVIDCFYNPHKSEKKKAFGSFNKLFRFTLLRI